MNLSVSIYEDQWQAELGRTERGYSQGLYLQRVVSLAEQMM